ncbi:hypothetical protein ABPG77_010952 [Micractinium sp. CCAP 211/92]
MPMPKPPQRHTAFSLRATATQTHEPACPSQHPTCLLTCCRPFPAAGSSTADACSKLRHGLLASCRPAALQGRTYTMQHACLFELRPSPGVEPAAAGQDALQWRGFVDMPGGGNRFTARWVPQARLYLALTNPSIDRYGANADARNILVLVYSNDLLSWRIATTVLLPNDGLTWEQSLWMTGYHYTDWIVDGSDILAAIRTAYDGAHSFHDSNMITFKRIAGYRQYLPHDPT